MPSTRADIWLTTLSGLRQSRPEWAEIAHYREPISRYLALRAPRLPEGDREDLVHEVLVAMAERLVHGYDPSRGRFRAFLQGAIDHKLADRARRQAVRRAEALDDGAAEALAAPLDDADAAAIDLEAELRRALAAFHDAHAQGDGDLDLVWCFADRLVTGLSEDDIAKKNGWSRDRVKRLLARARSEILRELCRSLIAREDAAGRAGGTDADGGAAAHERAAEEAAELCRQGLRAPGERERLGERAVHRAAARAADDLLSAIDAARRGFARFGDEVGRELRRGLDEVVAER